MPKTLSFGGSALRDVRDFAPEAIGEVVNHNVAVLEGMYRLLYNDINLAKTDSRQIADDAITEDAIVDGSVTAPKTALAAINGSTGNLNVLTVDEAQLIANAVSAAKTSLAAINSTTGAVNADHVVAAMINVAGLHGTTGRIVVVDTTDADVVTGGINSFASTLIQAGKIIISGGTNLDNWSHTEDATKVDGGHIYTQSLTANGIRATTITVDKLSITNIGTITNQLGNLLAGSLTGTTLTGGVLQTAGSGKRVRIDEHGIRLYYGGGTVGLYGTTGNGGSNITYGTTGNGGDNHLYGAGVLASINQADKKVPFRVETEQIYADFHYFNRGSTPSGAATIGDKCVVNGIDYSCTVAGTPGTWVKTGLQS